MDVPKKILMLCPKCRKKTPHVFWGVSPETLWYECETETCKILLPVHEDDLEKITLAPGEN